MAATTPHQLGEPMDDEAVFSDEMCERIGNTVEEMLPDGTSVILIFSRLIGSNDLIHRLGYHNLSELEAEAVLVCALDCHRQRHGKQVEGTIPDLPAKRERPYD
jgi:hypothetical protein